MFQRLSIYGLYERKLCAVIVGELSSHGIGFAPGVEKGVVL